MMKIFSATTVALAILLFSGPYLTAGETERIYRFGNWTMETAGPYQTLNIAGAVQAGVTGGPVVPWHPIVILLQPGEKAVSMEILREDPVRIPGKITLAPQAPVRPLSVGGKPALYIDTAIYASPGPYPLKPEGSLSTMHLDGYAMAVSSFSPAEYHPSTGTLILFRKVTVRMYTAPDPSGMNTLLQAPGRALPPGFIERFTGIPAIPQQYRTPANPSTGYQYLIIAPLLFKNEFQPLINLNTKRGMATRVVTVDSILSVTAGYDTPEKIRNFIIAQRQNHSIQYVLVAGNHARVPARGLFCSVNSGGTIYQDGGIPADLYYSALDGNFDANGNHIYGELTDNADLLPDIPVGRFPVNDTAALRKMIRKTVMYQTNPVLGELNRPLMVGEYLYNAPVTFGGPYMELLIGDHSDNGYFTHGIPPGLNAITRLYDTLISPPLNYWSWSKALLLAKINQGSSFMHHTGHANETYMLRLGMGDIVNQNFAAVNGTDRNFTLLYTHGCNCGAFDAGGSGCIAAKAVSIDNWLVAGVFNSRYGWFNQGTTDGPSEHLHREFVSALYHDTISENHLGTAHMISKIETAPWVSLPGEFEPGAQRWVHYDCNVFGDPALAIWTGEPASFTTSTWTGNVSADWNDPQNWSDLSVPTSLVDVIIAPGNHLPVISTVSTAVCHDVTILPGASLTVPPGKTVKIWGTLTLQNP
jgi:hypothetical protein